VELILSRHGNTFGPNDKVVCAGRANDLPLVAQGIVQAQNFALKLKQDKPVIEAIYCSPLIRTIDYAKTIIKALDLALEPIIDTRLNEIDYGPWTGLDNEEIAALYGWDAIRAWDEKAIWPSNSNWGESPAIIKQDILSFLREMSTKHQKTVIAITSNGRLRFFHQLFNLATNAKVKTGNICKISGHFLKLNLDYWNLQP
jgi:broad specificity phosphatase PhoE